MEGKIRDPLYGFVEYDEAERAVINSPAFQRLRRVRQLALANYVYPSANHTRFEHSLGAMHVAGIMARRFGLGEDTVRVVRLAALVHDIGHGPFGHVTEDAFKELKMNKGDDSTAHKFHERVTASIIRSPRHVGQYLGICAGRIAEILDPSNTDPCIEKDIVSGPLDADKIDYLRRDSYSCGVEYGAFDFHKLLDVLTAEKTGDIHALRVKHDGVHCVEQFVVAKFFITYQVYRHRIRLITDAMLVRAIRLSYPRNEYVKALYSFDGNSDKYLDVYLDSDDTKLLDAGADRDSGGRELFQMLRNRTLLKRVFHCHAGELLPHAKDRTPEQIKEQMERHKKELEDHRSEIESAVAHTLDLPTDHCILNVYSVRFEREKEIDAGKVMVLQEHGDPIELDECTEICKRAETKLRQMNIDVYAPLQNGKLYSPEDQAKIRGLVMKVLKGYVKNGGSDNATA